MKVLVLYRLPVRYGQASLVVQWPKNLPATAGDAVSPLHQHNPPEEELATHSSILAWESLGQRNLGEVQSIGLQSDMTEHTQVH